MKKILSAILISVCLSVTTSFAAQTNLTQNADVQNFINQMVEKHGFDQKNLETLFSHVNIRPEIIAAMNKPYESKPWYEYRRFFISQARINNGVKFWQTYDKTLREAEKQYGVPPYVVVAIIGIESNYGQYKGKFPVIDALSTLAFDYPKRAKFFSKELEEFLLLSRDLNMDPMQPMGSYAGAMGQPQFMPSSFRAYAVDFSGNGNKDLVNNEIDVIGSVANYFYQHGWKSGQPIADTANVNNTELTNITPNKGKPVLTIAELAAQGITPTTPQPANEKANLIELEKSAKQQEYWLGYPNFYVIMRYNPRITYAMAVYQLAEQIREAHAKLEANAA